LKAYQPDGPGSWIVVTGSDVSSDAVQQRLVRLESMRFLQKIRQIEVRSPVRGTHVRLFDLGSRMWLLRSAPSDQPQSRITLRAFRVPFRVSVPEHMRRDLKTKARVSSPTSVLLLDFDVSGEEVAKGLVYAFLPLTGADFGFPFHVNADWATGADRERLVFTAAEANLSGRWNAHLLASVCDAFVVAERLISQHQELWHKLPLFVPLLDDVKASVSFKAG
jgi:hypothetical protein